MNLHAGGGSSAAGSSLGAGGAAAASLGVLLCAALALVSGVRARRGLLVAACALAGLALVVLVVSVPSVARRAERTALTHPRVHPAPIVVALASAVVAAGGSAFAILPAGSAPGARLPEGAPDLETEPADE